MIDHIQMTNWRAYDEYELSFAPGITFLMGANGVGKTSILEAIAYALTGEPSTVERPKLLRNPGKEATVRLTFTMEDQSYRVERSQSHSSATGAVLIRLQDGKQLASSHRRVTEQIEHLMGISADFLQRIVYLAEGDVFRFLDSPPGKAMDEQIRYVLGLNQLDQFVEALARGEKGLKEPIRALQDVMADCERLGVRQDADLEQHVGDMDRRRDRLVADLRATQDDIARYQREQEDFSYLRELLDRAVPALRLDEDAWQKAQHQPVPKLFEGLETRISQAQAVMQQSREDLARLQGERSAYQRIVDILEPSAGRAETLPCPVCGKPMTSHEREEIRHGIEGTIRDIAGQAAHIETRRARAEEGQDRLRWQIAGLTDLRGAVGAMRFRGVRPDASPDDLMRAAQARPASVPVELEEKAGGLDRQLRDLESERAEYLAIRHRLGKLGYGSPEAASAALVALEVRAISLRAAHRAAQETLTTQRNQDIRPIYDKVARAWETFSGDPDLRMDLDASGVPVLQDRAGRRLDLTQFSGGQKTAFLIMLQTIIAYHFSRSDFLLIDEPLEHLDPVNRRSLIRFLMGSFQRQAFRQAIIATFEESLIRKYMSAEGVNIIHL